MKKVLGLLFILGLVAGPGMAQTITIDYAHEYDFKQVKTFQYVPSSESNADDPLMAGRIDSLIIMELKEGGLVQVEENPDIYVTYHITSEENTNYNTSSFGYGGGYMGGWGGWGYGGSGMATTTTTAYTYTKGTLVIDAYEAGEKKMIWRGSGTVTVKDSPQKVEEQIQKILHKMGKKWDKILKNKGK